MANRYTLTDEVKAKFMPIVKELIDKVEAFDYENDKDLPQVDLSGTDINPYTLRKLLEDLDYEEDEDGMDTNGWQMDFWITMNKSGNRSLQIRGCGITFELILAMKED